MSLDRHSQRFDPRWLLKAFETDTGETYNAADAAPCSPDEESTNDPTGRDFDEAIEQIATEGRCVCPLCGAIVASDGSVVS
jgi:hypothetical protein